MRLQIEFNKYAKEVNSCWSFCFRFKLRMYLHSVMSILKHLKANLQSWASFLLSVVVISCIGISLFHTVSWVFHAFVAFIGFCSGGSAFRQDSAFSRLAGGRRQLPDTSSWRSSRWNFDAHPTKSRHCRASLRLFQHLWHVLMLFKLLHLRSTQVSMPWLTWMMDEDMGEGILWRKAGRRTFIFATASTRGSFSWTKQNVQGIFICKPSVPRVVDRDPSLRNTKFLAIIPLRSTKVAKAKTI